MGESRKEFRIVYDHNGYVIGAGSNGWIPSRETAEKIMERYKNDALLYRDCELYLEERETEEPLDFEENGTFNGRTVYSRDWFYYDAARPGDYVDGRIAEDAGNCVPPVRYSSTMIQCGEPHSTAYDANTGKHRNTYSTFIRVAEGVWEYRGNCFAGRTDEPDAEAGKAA